MDSVAVILLVGKLLIQWKITHSMDLYLGYKLGLQPRLEFRLLLFQE